MQGRVWPGLNNQIEQVIQQCETCLRYMPAKPKELLLPHEVPSHPWQKIGSDLFQFANKDYVIIVEYFSLWPEVYLLAEANSKSLIEACKDAFARHGIPEQFISDNGPQYSSLAFRQFTEDWQFDHKTSSPHYPRSNGLAESTVKSVKKIIKKCHIAKEDVKKGLLVLRNSRLACGSSPAQLLYGHALRDNLPSIAQERSKSSDDSSRDLCKEREF